VKTTGSFDNAFYVAGALLVVGAVISLAMTRRPIDFDAPTEAAPVPAVATGSVPDASA
jgi:hypothetical protein